MALSGRIRARRALPGGDRGFTLVEVMVALVLMSMVLLAGGAFMIRSMFSSSALVGRQGAVSVANQVLEQVRAVNPTFDTHGVSPLVYGRTQAAVTAQWAAAATAGVDISGTYTGAGSTSWDAAAYDSGSHAIVIPLTQTVTPSKQAYTVNTLIGTCVKPLLSATCGQATSGDELYRVVVRVIWTPSTGSCSGAICSFTASALIDPTQDPVFNVNRRPVANPDTATVASGSSVDIGVTSNDSGAFPVNSAVTIAAAPGHGTASVYASNNIVKYTPTAGFSGTDTFTYTVSDTSGRASNVATVTITVTPVAVADTSAVSTGGTVTVAALSNDLGTGLSLVSVTTPNIGTASLSGSSVRYVAPSATGTATMTYTAQDSSAQQFTGTLTITVRPPAPVAYSYSLCRPVLNYQGNLMQAVSGTNLSASGLTLTTTTAGLNGWAVSGVSSSGVVTITKTSTATGTVNFSVTDPTGQTSNTATVTLIGGNSC